jgi:hypothetical protein
MVADSLGDVYQPRGLQREQDGQYQHHQHSLEEQERYHRQWQQEQSLSLFLSAFDSAMGYTRM